MGRLERGAKRGAAPHWLAPRWRSHPWALAVADVAAQCRRRPKPRQGLTAVRRTSCALTRVKRPRAGGPSAGCGCSSGTRRRQEFAGAHPRAEWRRQSRAVRLSVRQERVGTAKNPDAGPERQPQKRRYVVQSLDIPRRQVSNAWTAQGHGGRTRGEGRQRGRSLREQNAVGGWRTMRQWPERSGRRERGRTLPRALQERQRQPSFPPGRNRSSPLVAHDEPDARDVDLIRRAPPSGRPDREGPRWESSRRWAPYEFLTIFEQSGDADWRHLDSRAVLAGRRASPATTGGGERHG